MHRSRLVHNHLPRHVCGGEPLLVFGETQGIPDVLELSAARLANFGELLAVGQVPDPYRRVAPTGQQALAVRREAYVVRSPRRVPGKLADFLARGAFEQEELAAL